MIALIPAILFAVCDVCSFHQPVPVEPVDPTVVREAAVLLGGWVTSDDVELRAAAARALASMGSGAEPAKAALLERLRLADEATIQSVSYALEELPSAKEEAVPLFERLLKENPRQVRLATALAALDPGNPHCRACVLATLDAPARDRESLDEKRYAIQLIPRLDGAYLDFFPTLAALLYDEDLQDDALEALFAMEPAGSDEAFVDEMVEMVWRPCDRREDRECLSNHSAAWMLYRRDRRRFVEELSRVIETGPDGAFPTSPHFWQAPELRISELRGSLVFRLERPHADDDAGTALALIEALQDIGPGKNGLRALTRYALGETGREAVTEADVQEAALFALSEHSEGIGEDDLRRLRAAVNTNRFPKLRSHLLWSLQSDSSTEAREIFLEAAQSGEEETRCSARRELVRWAPDERAYEEVLKSYDTKKPVATAIGAFPQHRETIVAKARAALLGREPLESVYPNLLLSAIADVDPDEASRIAATLLDDPSHPHFDDATSYFIYRAEPTMALRDEALRRLDDPRFAEHRFRLLSILDKCVEGSGEIPDLLRRLADDQDGDVRESALYTMRRSGAALSEDDVRFWLRSAVDLSRRDREPAETHKYPGGTFARFDAVYEAELRFKLAFRLATEAAMKQVKVIAENGDARDRIRIAELFSGLFRYSH